MLDELVVDEHVLFAADVAAYIAHLRVWFFVVNIAEMLAIG